MSKEPSATTLLFATKILDLEITTYALTELLIEKGVFTQKELDDKYTLVNDSYAERIMAEMNKIIRDNPEDKTE